MKSGTFVTNDGTCWESITSESCMRGRIAEHNVFKERSGPTSYAKRRSSPETGKMEGSTTLDKLDVFISILHVRDMYGAKLVAIEASNRPKLTGIVRVDIDNDDPIKLPETILFYNSTKFGADIADQMARKYFVKAGSRRWPVHAFYNIHDLAGINLLEKNLKEVAGKKLARREYLQQLI
ncbi:DDE_Tnp_1_7 domain-containing protein [Trichonephila clavipes]|nr:DDE_Tnp_1_7 domain-containing protein [Trichonephila clavipes]